MPGSRDQAQRVRAQRVGRQKGCRVYIDAETLERAGISQDEPPPYYRCTGFQRSANGHTVLVTLYREP